MLCARRPAVPEFTAYSPRFRRDEEPAYPGADRPRHRIGAGPRLPQPDGVTDISSHEMVPVRIDQQPLTPTAGPVWSDDLSRQLRQLLFDTADGITFLLATSAAPRQVPHIARANISRADIVFARAGL